jgi:hypothetical protein
MLIFALGLGLTAVLLAQVGYWGRMRAAELGSMSQQWMAAHNASQPSSSQ